MTEDIYAMESIDDLVEELEEDYEESDGLEEMIESRRRRRPRPRTATGRNLSTPRPQGNYVTQVQLQTALQKVSEEIQTNSRAVGVLNSRVEAVAADQAKQLVAIRKEISERRKQDDQQKRDVRQQLSLLAILPLITGPKSREIVINNEKIKVLVDEGDTFDQILPLMLISGGMGGGSGSDGGGYDSTMMPMMMALALRD